MRAERARRAAEAERKRIAGDFFAIKARCQHLAGFVREAWAVLEPNTPYIHGWHIDAICDHLEAITDGRINRLLVNVPPGTAKSLIVSVFWPAWEWGPKGRPSLRYLTTTYTENYVKRDSRRMRDLVQSDWYQALWGEAVTLNRTGEASFANTATGFREGVPFASLTSGRGDRVIIDDPHSTETAESEAERARTLRIFRESVPSRVNDPIRSAIVVIMQRLHADDVSGQAIKLGLGYTHLCLPMEFEVNRRCTTDIGFTDPRSYEGELLFPERFPREVVERDIKAMGPYATAGQYQQRPSPREGAFFQRSWFNRFDQRPNNLRIYGTSDYAVTIGKGDWTVHRIWGVAPDGDIYLLGGWRGRTDPDTWIEEKLNLIRDFKPACWFGEGGVIRRAIEPALVRRMRERKVFCRLEWLASVADKATRARGIQARAAMGAVWVRDGAAGDAWIEELINFPSGEHDDEVDAASLLGRALDEAHPGIAPSTTTTGPRDRWDDDAATGRDSWKVA